MGVTQSNINIAQTGYTANSATYDLNDNKGFSVIASWTDDTSDFSAKTFDTGVPEVATLTFDTKANTTHADYITVYDQAGGAWAVAASKQGVQEVTDMTCVADTVAVAEITDITAVADGSVKEITSVTCVADVSDSLDKKYFILYDDVGSVGFWYDVDNSGTQVDPALVAATDRQVEITTLATNDTAITVATKTYTAIVADAKFEAGADNLDGSFTVQSSTFGVKTDGTAGNSGFTVAEDTAGVDSTLDGTYFLLQDTNGSVAFWIDVDDSGTTIPAGASGADRAVEITTVSAADTANTIAGLLETAIHADAKFTASSAADVCTVTNVDTESLTDAADGDTGFSFNTTTQGVTADLLDGTYFVLQDVDGSVAFWIDTGDTGTAEPAHGADRSVEITTVTSGMTASQVAGVVATAINGDAKYAASAASEVVTITNADYKDLTDAADGDSGFTFNVTTQGVDLGAEPTGAIWTAIPSANKTQADISGDTTAAQVAARFELAFDGLTGFSAVITSDDTAADGTMTMTQVVPGTTTDPVPKNADDSGAGSISTTESTAGVDEEVQIATEYLLIPSHGFLSGMCVRGTTTGTLPGGLSLATDYFVKIVDANTIQLSATQGGSAVNLTNTGTGVHTLTPETTMAGTITVQKSHDGTTWVDTSDTITISASPLIGHLDVTDKNYRYMRLNNATTEGASTVTATVQVKY